MKLRSNNLYLSIKALIEQSKSQIVRNVNTTIVLTYFEIGKMIVEDEQSGASRAEYAEKTLKQLSVDLTRDYGKGFSHRNLEYFRKFYLTYSVRISQTLPAKSRKLTKKKVSASQNMISQTLSAFSQKFPLSWSHYVQLIKIESEAEMMFYEIEAEKGNWSVRELQRQFDSSIYERLALSKDKKAVKELAQRSNHRKTY
jgi:DUF1016 N-terminal domain